MELRHDACGNESRHPHHWRWKPLSDEVIGTRQVNEFQARARGSASDQRKVTRVGACERSRGDASDIDGQNPRGRNGADRTEAQRVKRIPRTAATKKCL